MLNSKAKTQKRIVKNTFWQQTQQTIGKFGTVKGFPLRKKKKINCWGRKEKKRILIKSSKIIYLQVITGGPYHVRNYSPKKHLGGKLYKMKSEIPAV